MKNKTTAAFLALFGGVFGVHRFYLNQAPMGILYILVFLVTIGKFPATLILGIFEAIRFFSMSKEEFDEKYNKGARQTARGRRTNRSRSSRDIRDNKTDFNREARRQRKPKSNPFKKSGLKKYEEYDIEGAVEDLNKALLVDQDDKDIYFALAGANSILENADEAYKNLELSIMKGFKDFERLQTEDNLAFLRVHKDWDAFRRAGFKSKKIHKLNAERPKENLLDDDVLLSQLNKLSELRKKGLLSDKEFEYERKKLMRG